ncbi:hypothetical protein K2X05_10495 [bacterium]|nr:hypothetical protein [bacterium]
MTTFINKLVYMLMFAFLMLSTQACSKKTFEAVKGSDVDGQGTASNGGSGTGGTATGGGYTSGGTATGGYTNGGTTGGYTTGCCTTGGTSTGGYSSGGMTTGGATNGGTTGGTTSGGMTSGGTTTGGMTNGGTTTAGTTTGGMTSGGMTSGGTTTGGTTTGGTTGGCTPFEPGCDHDNRYCITEKYQQPGAIITRKLDVWIITDSSSSMDAEREQLANGITNYISKMPAGTDVQFAVSLAHGPTSWFSGRLYKSDFKDPNEKYVISSSQYNTSQIQYWLRRKLLYRQNDYGVRAWDDAGNAIPGQALRNLPTDFDADGGEAGLISTYEAIRPYSTSPSRYESIQNLATTNPGERNFFRRDAALAIIYISDENDICYPDPTVADPDNLEMPYYNNYCSGMSAQKVLQRLQVVRESMPLYVSSIIYNRKSTIPAGLENGLGLGYSLMSQLASGTIIDVAVSNSIPNGLSTIGGLTSTRLDLRYDFILKYLNVDASTIQAKVDGVQRSHSYSGTTNTVHLPFAGGANSLVDIYYCLNLNAPLAPYQIQISSYLINTCRKAYQPNVVVEQP